MTLRKKPGHLYRILGLPPDSAWQAEAHKVVGYTAKLTRQSTANLCTLMMQTGPLAGRTIFIHNPTLRLASPPDGTCRCLAYPFPHRRGSGRCFDDGSGMFCAICGRSTEVYQPEPDSEYLSKCCHADVYSDPELLSPYLPPTED